MDQPGKVANPARGQLNRENELYNIGEGSWSSDHVNSPLSCNILNFSTRAHIQGTAVLLCCMYRVVAVGDGENGTEMLYLRHQEGQRRVSRSRAGTCYQDERIP